jgi:hypothetical protein
LSPHPRTFGTQCKNTPPFRDKYPTFLIFFARNSILKMMKMAVVLGTVSMVGCVDNLYADMLTVGATTFAAVIGEFLAIFATEAV